METIAERVKAICAQLAEGSESARSKLGENSPELRAWYEGNACAFRFAEGLIATLEQIRSAQHAS